MTSAVLSSSAPDAGALGASSSTADAAGSSASTVIASSHSEERSISSEEAASGGAAVVWCATANSGSEVGSTIISAGDSPEVGQAAAAGASCSSVAEASS